MHCDWGRHESLMVHAMVLWIRHAMARETARGNWNAMVHGNQLVKPGGLIDGDECE